MRYIWRVHGVGVGGLPDIASVTRAWVTILSPRQSDSYLVVTGTMATMTMTHLIKAYYQGMVTRARLAGSIN